MVSLFSEGSVISPLPLNLTAITPAFLVTVTCKAIAISTRISRRPIAMWHKPHVVWLPIINWCLCEPTLADLPTTSPKFPSCSFNPPLTPTPKLNSFFLGLRHPSMYIDVFCARNF